MTLKLSGSRYESETSQKSLGTGLPKEEIMRLLKKFLGLDKDRDLDFLSKLETGELEILLAAVRDRVERVAR